MKCQQTSEQPLRDEALIQMCRDSDRVVGEPETETLVVVGETSRFWPGTSGRADSRGIAVESRLEEELAQAADQIFGPGFRPKEANVLLRRALAEEVFTWPLEPTLGVFAIDVPSRRAYSRRS